MTPRTFKHGHGITRQSLLGPSQRPCFVHLELVKMFEIYGNPFGGIKARGYWARGGTWSYEAFCEPKNVAVALGHHHLPRWGF
jgi:hypothetical protein